MERVYSFVPGARDRRVALAAEPHQIDAADAEGLGGVRGVAAGHRQPASWVDHQAPLVAGQVGGGGNLRRETPAGFGLDEDAVGLVEARRREI